MIGGLTAVPSEISREAGLLSYLFYSLTRRIVPAGTGAARARSKLRRPSGLYGCLCGVRPGEVLSLERWSVGIVCKDEMDIGNENDQVS